MQPTNNNITIEDTLALVRSKSLKDLCSNATAILSRIASARGTTLYLLDETKRYLITEDRRVSKAIADESNVRKTIPVKLNGVDNKNNVCVYSIVSGKSTRIDDCYVYSGFDLADIYSQDKVTGEKSKNLLAVPLKDKHDFVVGVVQLVDVELDDATLPHIENIAHAVGALVDGARQIEKYEYSLDVLQGFRSRLEQENELLKQQIVVTRNDYSQIIGVSDLLKKALKIVDKAVETQVSVLLTGETGTGKELVAKAIHANGRRKERAFVAQNCATLPENLLESELFGYCKGAFSGAQKDKKGLFEIAHGGTLFLDEVGDLPFSLQAKLLRVLQEKEIRPLGSEKTIHIDVRIIAATHKNLVEMVKQGKFREDLYYRLSVFPITLPALRERREDIPYLAKYFLQQMLEVHRKSLKGINKYALDALMDYDYPGNIRELKNIIERMVVLCDENTVIDESLLPPELKASAPMLENYDADDGLKKIVAIYEAKVIKDALRSCQWNQTEAAQALKVGRRTLIDKIQRYQIKPSKSINH